jgi:hypothetical protein
MEETAVVYGSIVLTGKEMGQKQCHNNQIPVKTETEHLNVNQTQAFCVTLHSGTQGFDTLTNASVIFIRSNMDIPVF